MNTAEFEALLSSTIIPGNLSYIDQYAVTSRLSEYTRSITPKTLYRYRSINERNLDAFYKDQCWVSVAKNMNDGFDSRIYYDKQALSDWKAKTFERIDRLIRIMESRDLKDMPTTEAPNVLEFYAYVASIPKEQFGNISKHQICDMIDNIISSVETILPIAVQNTGKFCCLSEKIDSASMWGLYAADESGFALSFDFQNEDSVVSNNYDEQRTCVCYPVIYSDTRFQVPSSFVQFVLTNKLLTEALLSSGFVQRNPADADQMLNYFVCPDTFIPTKVALYKSSEWSRECEWRVCCTSNNDVAFQKAESGYFHKEPTALYLGRRISEINEKILKDIAREKKIPVFKMSLNDDNPTYKLSVELIQSIM